MNRLVRASNVGLVLRFIGDSCIEKLSNRVRYRIDGLLAVNDASQLFERYGALCVWGDKRFEERSPS